MPADHKNLTSQQQHAKVHTSEKKFHSFNLFSKTKFRPLVKAKIRNRDVTLFFDTGSPVNIISHKTYSDLFSICKINETDVSLQGIGDGNLNIMGETIIPLSIGKNKISESFIVIEETNLDSTLLIGFETMKRRNISICPGFELIELNGETFPLLQENPDEIENHTIDKVMIKKAVANNLMSKLLTPDDIVIEKASQQVISLYVNKRNMFRKTILILPETIKVHGLSITAAITQVQEDNLVFVEIQNDLNKEIKLLKNTVIVEAEIYTAKVRTVMPQFTDAEHYKQALISAVSNVEISKEKKEAFEKSLENIPDEQARIGLKKILLEFQDVFSGKNEPLGHTNVLKHKIKLEEGVKPIYVPAYRLPHKFNDEIKKTCEEMLHQGIIEESDSPYNFPLLVVPKKDNTWRIVVDFRRLNEKTIPDRYPVPVIDDILSQLGSHKWFTALDLLQGFLQIELDEESRDLCSFSTPQNHFRYKRLPFGLRSSPITFARLMNKVFGDLIGKILFVYIDDIIIFSDTIEEHLQRIRMVLQRLREVNLKVKISKCNFFSKEVTYLGHTLSGKGIKVVQNKVESIEKFPVPKNTKGILQFLGVTGYYRRYIHNYSIIASPLTDLLKKDVPFVWSDEQQNAFDTLKKKLIHAPVLVFPDYNKTFYIATDASNVGIGAVLLQKYGNKFHPIAYYSRKLKKKGPDETKYATIEKEALGVVNGLMHFKYIVFGYPVEVLTDHKPLLEFFNNYHTSPKRTRWFLTIQDFSAKISYIDGKSNIIADTLSRNPPDVGDVMCVNTRVNSNVEQKSSPTVSVPQALEYDLTLDELSKSQSDDENLQKIIQTLNGPKDNSDYKKVYEQQNYRLINGLLCKIRRNTRQSDDTNPKQTIFVPKNLKEKVLKFYHGHELNSHPGVPNLFLKVKDKFFWKNMFKDVRKFVKNCHLCRQHKGKTAKCDELLSYPIPSQPFERVHMDLLTNFNETNRSNKHILVICDALTRYVELVPLKNKTGKEVALAFYNNFICKFAVPRMIVTDNGTEFQNIFLDTLSKQLNFKKVNILPYRPEGNGLVERANRKVLDALRFSVGGAEPNWDLALPGAAFTINTTHHRAINMSPFEALYGFRASNPFDLALTSVSPNAQGLGDVLRNAKTRFLKLRDSLQRYEVAMAKSVKPDPKLAKFKPGDTVYVRKKVMKNLNYKLDSKFDGPFKVIELLPCNKFRVGDEYNSRICHSTALQLCN